MYASLRVFNVKDEKTFDAITEKLKEETFDLIKYAFDNGGFDSDHQEGIFLPYENVVWANHKNHMIILSETFPNLTFELTCQEMETFWREYYKDGDFEQCIGEVIFEQPRRITVKNDLF